MSITMAKRKVESEKTPVGRPKGNPSFKTIGFRVSESYADWLAEAADQDRVTVAAFIDRAIAAYSKEIGFDKEPPRRID